jgi:hypothetical protein
MEGRAIEVPVLTIMMMRVCDIIITGLSDEFSIRDAIHRLLVKPCYYESPNDKPKSKNCFS